MLPFVLLSLFETLYQNHTFRQSFYEYFFPIFHVIEVCLLGLAVIFLRHFSVMFGMNLISNVK